MADIAKETVNGLKELLKSKLYSDTVLEIHEYDDGINPVPSLPVLNSTPPLSSVADLVVGSLEADNESRRKRRKRSRWGITSDDSSSKISPVPDSSNKISPVPDSSSKVSPVESNSSVICVDTELPASNGDENGLSASNHFVNGLSASNHNVNDNSETAANANIVVDEAKEKSNTSSNTGDVEMNDEAPKSSNDTQVEKSPAEDIAASVVEPTVDPPITDPPTTDSPTTDEATGTGGSSADQENSDQADTEFECSSLYKSLKLHSLILHLHSPRFRQLLKAREKDVCISVINAEVRKGFGQFLEILVSSFYDPEVLNGLSLTQLLGVLEVAKTYGSEAFVKRCLTLLHEMKVDNFNQCELVLNQIANLESTSSSSDFLTMLKDQCVSFIAKQFGPLERNADEHEKFLGMSFKSLKCLVKGKMRFALSENSIVTFIIEWLEKDESRQIEQDIGELLSGIRVRFLTIDFLCDVVTPSHPILSKWNDFKEWYLQATTFHALSTKLKILKFPSKQNECSRNFVLLDQTLINATAWLIRMTEQEPGWFSPVPMLTTSNGYKIRPVNFLFKQMEGITQSRYDVILKMTSSGTLSNCRMFFAVLPYNKKYEKLTINLGTLPMEVVQATTINFEMQNELYEIKVGWSSQDFMNAARENGFYFVMLIVLDEEYEAWAKLSFACPCNHGVMHINGCCRKCGYSYFGKKEF